MYAFTQFPLWPALPETVKAAPDATGLGETAQHEEECPSGSLHLPSPLSRRAARLARLCRGTHVPCHVATVGGRLLGGYPDFHGACVRRFPYSRWGAHLFWLGSSLRLGGRVWGLAPPGSASPAIGRAVEER